MQIYNHIHEERTWKSLEGDQGQFLFSVFPHMHVACSIVDIQIMIQECIHSHYLHFGDSQSQV